MNTVKSIEQLCCNCLILGACWDWQHVCWTKAVIITSEHGAHNVSSSLSRQISFLPWWTHLNLYQRSGANAVFPENWAGCDVMLDFSVIINRCMFKNIWWCSIFAFLDDVSDKTLYAPYANFKVLRTTCFDKGPCAGFTPIYHVNNVLKSTRNRERPEVPLSACYPVWGHATHITHLAGIDER